MVERSSTAGFDEFTGVVENITLEPSQNPDIQGEQYHITMLPDDKKLVEGSKTGRFHEWVRVPPKATDTSVPEGSILDKYIQEVEMLHKEAKKKDTHLEVMALIKGRRYLFKRKKLGKAFEGHEAKAYWIPARAL